MQKKYVKNKILKFNKKILKNYKHNKNCSWNLFNDFSSIYETILLYQRNLFNFNNNSYINVILQCLFTQNDFKKMIQNCDVGFENYEILKDIFYELNSVNQTKLIITAKLEMQDKNTTLIIDKGCKPEEFLKFIIRKLASDNILFFYFKNFYSIEGIGESIKDIVDKHIKLISNNRFEKEYFFSAINNFLIISVNRFNNLKTESDTRSIEVSKILKIKSTENIENILVLHLNALIFRISNIVPHYYCFCRRENYWFIFDCLNVNAHVLTEEGIELMLEKAKYHAYMLFYSNIN